MDSGGSNGLQFAGHLQRERLDRSGAKEANRHTLAYEIGMDRIFNRHRGFCSNEHVAGEVPTAARPRTIVTGSAGVGVWTERSHHPGLRKARLSIGCGSGPSMAVQFVENGSEQHLAVLHCFLKGDESALNIGFAYVDGNGRCIADLLRHEDPAGNYCGTESQYCGSPVPLHYGYSVVFVTT